MMIIIGYLIFGKKNTYMLFSVTMIIFTKKKMKPVFKDNEQQNKFWDKGYLKLTLFTPEEIEELKAFYYSQNPDSRFNTQEKNVKYHFTFLDTNKEYKHKVFDFISQKIQPKLDEILNGYEPIIINFVQKEPGLGEIPVHQNWNFVDETKYATVSVWCPLVDVAEINGTIEVVEGTHKLFRNVLRSPSIPWFFTGYEKHIIQDYCKPVEVKAGEVLIFDDSIIHYSKPNNGTYNRLVIQVIAKPKEAPTKHYYMKKKFLGYEIEEMDVNKDFFLNFKYNITDKPEGELSHRKINYSLPKINKNKFDTIIKNKTEVLL